MPTTIAVKATKATTTGSDGERETNTAGAIMIEIETDMSRWFRRRTQDGYWFPFSAQFCSFRRDISSVPRRPKTLRLKPSHPPRDSEPDGNPEGTKIHK